MKIFSAIRFVYILSKISIAPIHSYLYFYIHSLFRLSFISLLPVYPLSPLLANSGIEERPAASNLVVTTESCLLQWGDFGSFLRGRVTHPSGIVTLANTFLGRQPRGFQLLDTMLPLRNAQRVVINNPSSSQDPTPPQLSSNQKSTIEQALPWLLCNVTIDLRKTTSEWSDGRSNRLVNSQQAETLLQSFRNQGVIRNSPENRMYAGMQATDFATALNGMNTVTVQWARIYCPTDNKPNPSLQACQIYVEAIQNQTILSALPPSILQMISREGGFKPPSGTLIASDANFHVLAPKDLRLPDLGWNQKMVSLSYYTHMVFSKNGYTFGHNGYVSDDA